MTHRLTLLASSMSLIMLGACSGNGGGSTPAGVPADDPGAPATVDDTFDFPEPPPTAYPSATFDENSALITNPLLSHFVGRTSTFEGTTEDGFERIVVEVLPETRMVDGVRCAVVLDRVTIDGELVEETWDWYAQDVEGNVWYMGEDSNDYEDGVLVSTAGSWETGLDVAGLGTTAIAGVQMLADPQVGDIYYQEYYEGEALDAAEVVALEHPVTLADGTTRSTVRFKEWNPYDPTGFEYKHYVSNVGLVLETDEEGEEPIGLVSQRD